VSRRTLDALGTSPVFPAHAAAASADQATHRADRPGWANLGPDVRNGPPNQMPQHPPLYYEAAGAFLRVVDGDGRMPLDRAVWDLRLLSVLFLLPVPLLAADIARRYSRQASVVLGAAVATLAVPQLTHVGATVSNDPLMVLLGSLTLAGAARIATGDRRWSTATLTGVAAGLALFTKGFAVPLVPAVAVAALLPLWHRSGREARHGVRSTSRSTSERPTAIAARDTLERAGLVALLALACGGWWWIHNVVAYGTPQPGVRLRDRVPGVDVDVARFAGDFSERLVGSFWGMFGWREAHLPIGVSGVLTALVVVAVVAAVWRRWDRLILVLPALAAAAMVLSSGWGAYKKTGVSYATQGRYLFAGIAGLAVLSALGLHRLVGTRGGRPGDEQHRPWQPVTTLAVALTVQATSLVICLQRYWAGGWVDRLRAMARFAPIPGPLSAGILAFTALAALAAVALLAPRRRPATALVQHEPSGA
jgi:4-amino-4-deoxy-L-arabinose transferase-like glycosyltransferase